LRFDSELKSTAHRAFEKVSKQIKEGEFFRPWKGAAYRVTTLDYPRPKSILLGQGSFLHGGRWNAMGSFRAVYGSTEDTVAVAESRATADYAKIPWPFRTPRLLVAMELSLEAILDLTDSSVRRRLGLTIDGLKEEDWRKTQESGAESLTQAIGRAVFTNGGEGLVVPSARVAGGVNVVFFLENQRKTSRVAVLESEKLERIRLA
jgi:RES domain-containing protein